MQKPFLDYISDEGKRIDAVIVWDKKQPGLGYMAYRRQCEFILFIKGGQFHKGDKSDVDLWSITRDEAQSYVHGTQKPVAVSARAINNSSKEGDVVLDLFGGSGSTMLACEQLNRRCRMMELDAHFADVIIARWEKFTGKQAIKIN
jgi:DNA modification methylase